MSTDNQTVVNMIGKYECPAYINYNASNTKGISKPGVKVNRKIEKTNHVTMVVKLKIKKTNSYVTVLNNILNSEKW